MAEDLELKNRDVWMEGDYSPKPVFMKNARVIEGLSEISEITIEFLSGKKDIDIQDFVGKKMAVGVKDEKDGDRHFSGICVSVEYVGLYQGLSHFVAEVRPWLWMLTRTRENRIYQEKSSVDIIQEIFSDYGFSSSVSLMLSETYEKRTYCVQYRETDYDFICRLMEEEGIYFFFVQDGSKEKLVLADSVSAHQPTPHNAEIDFHYREPNYRRRDDHIFEWNEASNITTGKVTLDDYDFEKPKSDKKTVKAMAKGKHSHKSYEHYHYPGHLRTEGVNTRVTRVRMEALAVDHVLSRGVCNVRTFGVGQTFKLKEHPRKKNNIEHLVVRAVHHLQIETDYEEGETTHSLIQNRLPVDIENEDTYRCFFDVIPKSVPYRAPLITPWPEVGMQTAVVTGPSGEEIHTDKYGRIKVQFHWDRLGKNDDKTTCWIRTVMPWTGKNWGMIAIPRIGQEVVIQFEEGDPDRPICTGMLYNDDTMPPYELPANKTMTGMTTRSTKQGSKDTHHELVFEDKKDNEYVRFQSERDYLQIIKNNATINIGDGHKKDGDLRQVIHNNKTEVVGSARTHVVGLVEDFTVGYLFEETTGIRKNQTVGIYSEEKVGLRKPDNLKDLVKSVASTVLNVGGPVSAVVYEGKYNTPFALAGAVNGLIGLGYGKKSEINGTKELDLTGDFIQTIAKSKSPAPSKPGDFKTTVKDGDHILKVDKGKQMVTVSKGDRQVAVETGDLITGVDKGHYKTTVKLGDHKLSVKAGKSETDAMSKIELKCGGSKITIDPMSITIKAATITLDASMNLTAKGGIGATLQGGASATVKGGIVMIN